MRGAGRGSGGQRRPGPLHPYYAQQGERIFDIARRHARARDLAAANHARSSNGDPEDHARRRLPADTRLRCKGGTSVTQEQITTTLPSAQAGISTLALWGRCAAESTFIKRFAELMLLPRIKNEARRARAHDELPQSAAGRNHHDHRAKVHPRKAVKIDLSGGGSFKGAAHRLRRLHGGRRTRT